MSAASIRNASVGTYLQSRNQWKSKCQLTSHEQIKLTHVIIGSIWKQQLRSPAFSSGQRGGCDNMSKTRLRLFLLVPSWRKLVTIHGASNSFWIQESHRSTNFLDAMSTVLSVDHKTQFFGSVFFYLLDIGPFCTFFFVPPRAGFSGR